MSIKADWDMNINLNKLIKEVENDPRGFYDKVDADKKKIKNKDDIFAATTRRKGNHYSDILRTLDDEHAALEKELTKKQSNIETFENLISQVSRDIDKKSSYSRKLEN